VFTVEDRTRIVEELVEHARTEVSVTAAALVGSGARQQTDRWSDIDLALRLDPSTSPLDAADAWALHLGARHEVADQLDLWAGDALYRVFLLRDSLQIDLSFWPSPDFASTGEPFQLIFGEANATTPPPAADPRSLIGWAWLHALHARSAIARGRPWQALQMVQGLRDQVISLACLRHGLPAHQARGVDGLPDAFLTALEDTLVPDLSPEALVAAFTAGTDLLLAEVVRLDSAHAERLRPPLAELTRSVRSARHR
jgi:predicted nucleotidyltransferase